MQCATGSSARAQCNLCMHACLGLLTSRPATTRAARADTEVWLLDACIYLNLCFCAAGFGAAWRASCPSVRIRHRWTGAQRGAPTPPRPHAPVLMRERCYNNASDARAELCMGFGVLEVREKARG